ncbi:MAG: ABC transporter ATP-binding protein [Gemmatimonadota bacterium]
MSVEAAFDLTEVRFSYPGGGRPAIAGTSLRFAMGRHSMLVGPNGAGKSTLLRLMSGVLRPDRGQVRLFGRGLSDWGRRELACRVAVVTQDDPPGFPLPLRAFVGLGRNPHLRTWQGLGTRDREVIEASLDRVDLRHLAERFLPDLSGGERQRAKLARALAQEPSVLLLDEPTAHLDLGHQVRMFELVRELIRADRLTVVSITHDLHLASRYGDSLALLSEGRLVVVGSPHEVLQAEHLSEAFGWPIRVVELGALGFHAVPLSGWGRE